MLFLYFKLCQPASFEPVDQLKAYTHHFKALEIGNLNEYLKGTKHMADPVVFHWKVQIGLHWQISSQEHNSILKVFFDLLKTSISIVLIQ